VNRWIVCPDPRPGHHIRLFCFSYAGGGASLFCTWPHDLSPDIEICAIQLPGRESRLTEAPYAEMGPLIDMLSAKIGPLLDRPFAFFGHSMGALVSFELARSLRRRSNLSPLHLIVSGRGAAHRSPRVVVDHRLPTDEMIGALRRLDGTPEEVLLNRELMELVLPTIRADFAVCGTYAYRHEPPLACPITAFGSRTDPHVSIDDLAAWRAQTNGPFSLRTFEGGHFFVRDARTSVLRAVQQTLSQAPMPIAAAA
jgi:medium-chain acyl-[acyl-carrier-protein] hydrolase